jgi:hypothetical protein
MDVDVQDEVDQRGDEFHAADYRRPARRPGS